MELKTKLDLAKIENDRVKALIRMECLMLDEVSMWETADAPLHTPTLGSTRKLVK